jgi:hypothetical protein
MNDPGELKGRCAAALGLVDKRSKAAMIKRIAIVMMIERLPQCRRTIALADASLIAL